MVQHLIVTFSEFLSKPPAQHQHDVYYLVLQSLREWCTLLCSVCFTIYRTPVRPLRCVVCAEDACTKSHVRADPYRSVLLEAQF